MSAPRYNQLITLPTNRAPGVRRCRSRGYGPSPPFRHGRQPRVAEREKMPQAPGAPPHPAGPHATPGDPRAPGPLSPPSPPRPSRSAPGPLGIGTDSCSPHAGSDPPPTTSPRLPASTLTAGSVHPARPAAPTGRVAVARRPTALGTPRPRGRGEWGRGGRSYQKGQWAGSRRASWEGAWEMETQVLEKFIFMV